MLTRAQQITMKRAQAQAGLSDGEYRELLAVELGFGVRSSTDPSLGDRHMDKFMAFVEAIFWRKVEAGALAHDALRAAKKGEPFQARGYWAGKNSPAVTSRDRFVAGELAESIVALEGELSASGCRPAYLEAIRRKTMQGSTSPRALANYQAALKRTLAVRRQKEAVS